MVQGSIVGEPWDASGMRFLCIRIEEAGELDENNNPIGTEYIAGLPLDSVSGLSQVAQQIALVQAVEAVRNAQRHVTETIELV